MKLIDIENIKSFTAGLFAGDVFDRFLLVEASFSTAYDVHIDGHLNADFLDAADALAETKGSCAPLCAPWKMLRPLCYEIIKGDRLPLGFKIVLMASPSDTENFLARYAPDFSADVVNALFLNIRFDGGKLTATTGTSLKSFTMDKSLDDAWDSYVTGVLAEY